MTVEVDPRQRRHLRVSKESSDVPFVSTPHVIGILKQFPPQSFCLQVIIPVLEARVQRPATLPDPNRAVILDYRKVASRGRRLAGGPATTGETPVPHWQSNQVLRR